MSAFRSISILVIALLLSSGTSYADERILNYHSDVLIHSNGSVNVTETIRVRAEGNNIRRGIYRDFPTSYTDRHGNRYRVTFNVLDVQRNNQDEAFHTEKRSNGIRVYIDSSSQLIPEGIHEYRLRYQSTRQLGFFDDYDELYWNVTGNGWIFPIDQASASIELPAEVAAADLRTAFYTGARGASGTDADVRISNARKIEFQTTRALQAREGLTIAVGFPKGLVHEPTGAERVKYFLSDNGSALALLIGLLAPLGWYLWAWNLHGRDPRKGVVIPLFTPPEGLSPGGCSYIRKMSFRQQAFTAAVVSLGVKGYLEIHDNDDDYVLKQKQAPADGKASKGEQGVFRELFSAGNQIELEQKNHQVFAAAKSALNKALKAEHLGRLFNLNLRFALPALVMTVVAVLIAALLTGGPAAWIIFTVLTLFMHILFVFLMRAPTPAGRQIMDEIDGFKMFLDTAEQDRLERMKSPQLTPEVFESFLPYAFALGVENSWCSRFNREFPEDVEARGGYHPAWYIGSHSGLGALNSLADNFNSSFSTAIASAATPPGSSSGSGGGGFSGGGGGGGGGGGW